MSGGSSANNSWTILTPEETVAETLRPLAEGTDNHGGSLTSAAGCGENRPADCAQSAEGLPVERHLVSKEEKPAELSEDTELHRPAAVTDASVPSQSEGLPETTASTCPDADSFSDSYAHVAPSPDEPSASLPSTETLGGVEFTQEEERLAEEGTRHQLDREELQQEGEESDLSAKPTDLWKQAVYLVDQLVMEWFSIWARRLSGEAVVEEGEGRSEKTGEEAEPELRRRRSLLAALERIGRTEEDEEVEEEFRLPQRGDDDNDSGFSVNKCILAVVILIGLGTIFFSESEYGTMEQKGAEETRKREWLNPEVPPLPVDADSSELLNKQQISLLQAQLQEQKAELKVAKLQADEGVKERLQWEEMEKENSRLKKEMASLPVLQKENERMKRELESVPALQRELESLRSTVTELKLSSAASEAAQAAVKSVTSPPSGQPGNGSQASARSKERQPKKPWDDQRKDVKKDRIGQKELKEGDAFEWKEGKKRERKDDGKTEWQQGSEQGKFDKEKEKGGKQKHHGEETKQWKDKERKKEKTGREDEGKSWKYKEGKKEWIEKSERKEKVAEDWKKTNRENSKQWRGEEEKKDWKVGKDHAGKHKSKDEWKGEKEWKKGKDVVEASLKKDWKKKGEKKDGDWKSKDGKAGKGKDDRKQRDESKNHGNERKLWNENEQKNKNGKAERKKAEESWKRGGEGDKKPDGDRKRDVSSSHTHRDEHKSREGHRWGDGELPHTHSRASPGQPEYWLQQRLRLQRRPKPPRQCGSAETCARAEGLLPVPFPEFRALLQTYLAKAEEAGVDASEREELDKLASEFFRDGVFAHDQTSFREFVDNLEDILEDLVEGDDDAGGEDSEAEDEMEEFEREVIERFSAPGAAEKVGGSKGEWRKQSGPGRG
ncbi:pre-B-cell leukemia homeobox interacting protein 1b isoform X5 [Gasterosteus aculeatus]